jgi:hypothetical protein
MNASITPRAAAFAASSARTAAPVMTANASNNA